MPLIICESYKVLSSRKCVKKCSLKKSIDTVKIDDISNEVGSPHFRVCHLAKGRPIIGEFKNNKKKWKKVSLCFDRRKKNFISSHYINNKYKKTLNKNNQESVEEELEILKKRLRDKKKISKSGH